jgi:hypothetical protein
MTATNRSFAQTLNIPGTNFGDPASLHGEAMPGLKELQANASKIKITYSELPSGAQINFETSDIHTSTAIHRWF